MPVLTSTIHDEEEMEDLAASLSPRLKAGDVVTLSGDLGAGKTAFARALINVMSEEPEEVPSPTFTLVQVYETDAGTDIWHFDLYRLPEEEMDILELGWEEARRFGISLVEWPDRLGSLLPADRLEISIEFHKDSENMRSVTLTPHGKMIPRMEGL